MRRLEGVGDTGAHRAHLARVEAEVLHGVPCRGVGDREHQVGALEEARREQVVVPEYRVAEVVPRIDQRDEVVERRHRPRGRPHDVAVEQIVLGDTAPDAVERSEVVQDVGVGPSLSGEADLAAREQAEQERRHRLAVVQQPSVHLVRRYPRCRLGELRRVLRHAPLRRPAILNGTDVRVDPAHRIAFTGAGTPARRIGSGGR
jgi:hypothetical protein